MASVITPEASSEAVTSGSGSRGWRAQGKLEMGSVYAQDLAGPDAGPLDDLVKDAGGRWETAMVIANAANHVTVGFTCPSR